MRCFFKFYFKRITKYTIAILQIFSAFNTNGIVYDNTPWRPGREIDIAESPVSEEDERKMKNLATRIMSNGVEVLVKDKNEDAKQDQRKLKYMPLTSMKPLFHQISSPPHKSLLSSAVATLVNHQQMSAIFPLQLMPHHNYIIKTCMTTYTYLTTIVHNKRSAISTFETIVSVVTTESLTNPYATETSPGISPTKVKFMEVKTTQASTPLHLSNLPKIDKRIDTQQEDSFDLIQPSEHSHHEPCTGTCSCSHTKTEGLKTKYPNVYDHSLPINKYAVKTSKYGAAKIDVRPTKSQSLEKNSRYPYEYENSQPAPTDRIVEKYTEVINDFSDEKDNSVQESELLTNEQAPTQNKITKLTSNIIKTSEKPQTKPEKPQKPNKNKVLVADLLKLGSLGIKGLSQLAPVFEKMTGGFIKRQDTHKNTSSTTTTTAKPEKLTPYNVDKRIDSEISSKHSSFPIYIPVDELETSESQLVYTNATLHQNLAWAAEHKQPKVHIYPPKMIHESPLVNGGIPISPGEIITANSDVIVGKPAVGGPLTLAASGIKLHNQVNLPPIDSFVAGSEQYVAQEKPSINEQMLLSTKVDDSFDLRPPEPPKPKQKPYRNVPRPSMGPMIHQHPPSNNNPHSTHHSRVPPPPMHSNDYVMKTEHIKTNAMLSNHGRPAFLDYIPSLANPENKTPNKQHNYYKTEQKLRVEDDNSPSSSEIVNSHITSDGDFVSSHTDQINKPLLVDIQPSRVANVLIPHGSDTALVFAGSSEPHKTGDYVDDPLPYPEPGYFGSFSIDAPQMTNVHNVPTTVNKHTNKPTHPPLDAYKHNTQNQHKDHSYKNDLKPKWKDNKRPSSNYPFPPPVSNQETHVQVGPQITVYNPDIYSLNNGEIEKYNNVKEKKHKEELKVIDKDYENYLSVPPPPPPKMHFNQESHHDNKKPYNQRPVVHMKPVQDMSVFINIQHPTPEMPKPEAQPPKITSEIYFAAQSPNTQSNPSYTFNIPTSNPAPNYGNSFHKTFGDTRPHFQNTGNPATFHNDGLDKDNTYSVTLNTATNVASHGEAGQVIGSSIPIAVGTSNVDQLNTDIPVGTNFAIKVDDEPSSYGTFNSQDKYNPLVVHDEHGRVPSEVTVGDNRWNKSTSEPQESNSEITVVGNNYFKPSIPENISHKDNVNQSVPPSTNSHANFPMMNEYSGSTHLDNIKPVTEEIKEVKPEQRKPTNRIPNAPSNSHGWYSNILLNQNTLNNINNIKIEATTRKSIPLHNYHKDSVPEFGQKVTSIGKPPTDFWTQSNPPHGNYNLGKPFVKQESSTKQPSSTSTIINKPQINYIPSYYGGDVKQPAYDIPIRDNSDETTTYKTTQPSKEVVKPVFENSEEVYDGEDLDDGENDGEVSQESIKVPVITSSSEDNNVVNKSESGTGTTLLQDEVIDSAKVPSRDRNVQMVDFNQGTQTEKPFGSNNKTHVIQSNTIRPIYSQMKPRPFTVHNVLDHQLQQPHWQINHLAVNSTNVSYEENLDLNIGEEMGSRSTKKPYPTTSVPHRQEYDNKYRRPLRPSILSNKQNKTRFGNDSNIITSTVHINDKKPFIVQNIPEKSTSPPVSLTTLDINRSSSEIIDLSPPPPTMDYNFKPSTNDEMIMGMSPPPPATQPPRIPTRSPPTPRPVPIRTPPPYRTKPPRTIAPRLPPTQRPIRRPTNRDEVSTYRPSYDVINNAVRPSFNRDHPSSQLLPPPRNLPSRITPVNDFSSIKVTLPTVVFPTPISSGWLTSSGVDFPPDFNVNFAPTSVLFPDSPEPSKIPETVQSTSDYPHSYETSSQEHTSAETTTENKVSISKDLSSKTPTRFSTSSEEQTEKDLVSSQFNEDTTTDKMKVIPIPQKNRTRKPYPFKNEEKKPTTPKYRLPVKPLTSILPTKTLSRPEILYSTRYTTRKPLHPLPTRPNTILPSSIIESSESSFDDEFVKGTELLNDIVLPSTKKPEYTISLNKVAAGIEATSVKEVPDNRIQATHHAGNEVKIEDNLIPSTKTEFKTTVVTLTKTLSEPPRTVSSIGYVNLTHTLTVTHTKTNLVSQYEGAKTETLVLTNTRTSTIVDVITKIHTQVLPTTIIETVTKHLSVPNVEPTPVLELPIKTKGPLDDLTMSSEENDNLIIRDPETTENVQKIDTDPDGDNDTFFVVMNKSQNGGKSPPINTDLEGDYDITRNEQVNSNGVSQVLFGEILLAGTPYLETTNVVNPTGVGYGKECQPDCKASRNERCQRIDGIMKCVCRPGFARMFPDRPCKPTYTYSVKLALDSQGNDRLLYRDKLADNATKEYHALAVATHEGINRMVMQSDLRDVYHGVHITGFHPIEMRNDVGDIYQGVMNEFYVQLSDNAHESRLKEVIEKYLRNNNYSLGGTEVHAAGALMDKLEVSDFDECTSGQFHDCSEHAQCFNLRGTYTCSCLEGFADLSVNNLYPGRICSAEPVGCEKCNYHGACYSRDDRRVLCECFQWYAGSTCHINLKVVLISLVVLGALLTVVLTVCAIVACRKPRPPPRSIVTCIQGMPSLHQAAIPSKHRADRRALISDRGDSGDTSSVQNASLPYMPAKRNSGSKKCLVSAPPAHSPPPPPAPAVLIPRARLHPHHSDSRENVSRRRSVEITSPSEAKLISYLESGAVNNSEEMRRKHSMESSYSANKERNMNKQGALVSAGFKVSTTIRPEEAMCDRDDDSSVHKTDLDAEMHFDSLRKSYSQEELSEWTDAERRIGELTLSEARSVGGTLPASTCRAASSTRMTHQEANTMAERDLGSTFLLPHVHLYKPDLTSDVSEFDSL